MLNDTAASVGAAGALGGVQSRACLDASDVAAGEEVDAVTVETSAGAVAVLDGSWVGMPGQDLRITQRTPVFEGVGDGGASERVRADVTWDVGCLRDAGEYPVGVSAVDGNADFGRRSS